MIKYVAFLRGINVGGNKKVPMSDLKKAFESLGFTNVLTYINSGNVIFESKESPDKISQKIKTSLAKNFKLGLEPIKVLVITKNQLTNIIKRAPKGFGQEPEKYYSDISFLIDVSSVDAFEIFDPNPDVDTVWKGPDAIYHRRLIAKMTKSRLSKIIGKPIYKNMTIRNWNTITKLLALMN